MFGWILLRATNVSKSKPHPLKYSFYLGNGLSHVHFLGRLLCCAKMRGLRLNNKQVRLGAALGANGTIGR